jgi:hypothetical protein
VLKLTGDTVVMGTVIAIAAIPRAIFMLVGGAVTDRYSPRTVMLISNAARMVLVAVLAVTTWQESVTVWMIYGIGFLFGLADAFMFPAASAFPPRLLPPERLAAGNSLFQGSAQLTLVLGPSLAGALIAGSSSVEAGGLIEDSAGLATVFALDTLSFVVPLIILGLLRDRYPPESRVEEKIGATIVEGLRYVFQDVPLRTFTVLLAAFSLFFRGPFSVGIPAFADAFLPEGAAAFGIIMAGLGVGSIAGTILAGVTGHPAPARLGVLLLLDFLAFGLLFVFMSFFPDTWLIAGAVLVAAVLDGYVIVVLITWTQRRVATEKLGRVMSVVMMASQGLFPFSAAGAGALAELSLTGMLLGAGSLMVLVTLFGFSFRTVRRMGHA